MTGQQRRLPVSGTTHNRTSKGKTRRMRQSLRVSRSALLCCRSSKPNKHSAGQVAEKRKRRRRPRERLLSRLQRMTTRSSNVYAVQATNAKVWTYLVIVQRYLLLKDGLRSQLLLCRTHRYTRLSAAAKKPINLQLARLPRMMLAPLDRMIAMQNPFLLVELLRRLKKRQTLVMNKTRPKKTKKRIQWTKRLGSVKNSDSAWPK
jgi:hypothetical protein